MLDVLEKGEMDSRAEVSSEDLIPPNYEIAILYSNI